jgi:hypothetical protein
VWDPLSDSLPLADRLAKRHIPFLFQTSDPTLLRGAQPDAPALVKPFRREQLIGRLPLSSMANGAAVANPEDASLQRSTIAR